MYSVYNVDRLACVLLHFSFPIVMIMLAVISCTGIMIDIYAIIIDLKLIMAL